jgi:hypothetical protein
MTDTSTSSDVIKKNLTPEDNEFLRKWMTHNGKALSELAQHFCRFPGNVEGSVTLKMREMAAGQFHISYGDVTASRREIDQVMAEHEAEKQKASLAPE